MGGFRIFCEGGELGCVMLGSKSCFRQNLFGWCESTAPQVGPRCIILCVSPGVAPLDLLLDICVSLSSLLLVLAVADNLDTGQSLLQIGPMLGICSLKRVYSSAIF